VNTLTYPGLMIFEIFVGKMGFLGRGLGIRNIEKAKCGAFSLLTIFFEYFFYRLNVFLWNNPFFLSAQCFFLFGPSFFAVFFPIHFFCLLRIKGSQ